MKILIFYEIKIFISEFWFIKYKTGETTTIIIILVSARSSTIHLCCTVPCSSWCSGHVTVTAFLFPRWLLSLTKITNPPCPSSPHLSEVGTKLPVLDPSLGVLQAYTTLLWRFTRRRLALLLICVTDLRWKLGIANKPMLLISLSQFPSCTSSDHVNFWIFNPYFFISLNAATRHLFDKKM